MDQAYKLSDGYKNWAAFVEEVRPGATQNTSMAKYTVSKAHQIRLPILPLWLVCA